MLFCEPAERDRDLLPHDPFNPAPHIVVFGQVVGVHLDERCISDGRVDTAALRPIARCGYKGDYTVVDELFEMLRPD